MTARHVYVHVPFCRRRCIYCDFSIAVRHPVPVDRYVRAVAYEWRRLTQPRPGEASPSAAPRPSTVYLGGGTPSLLGGTGAAAVARVLGVGPGLDEFTLEANPEDVRPDALGDWVRAGVNRLSIGAQSFDEHVLQWMHRTHDAGAIADAVANARRAGVPNVSLDVIFALPEALGRDLDADLDRVLALEPQHVSIYGLTIEDHTPLGRRAARRAEAPAPERRYEEEYLRIHERLGAEGYVFYEVSNAARPGFEAVHNRAYWTLAPYTGLGPAAHSFDGTARWWNEAAYAHWLNRLENGVSPVAGREILHPEESRVESRYLGLRTSEGITLPEPVPPSLAAAVAGWVSAGWAEVGQASGGADGRESEQGGAMRLTLTPRGWLRLDELAASI